MRIAVVLTAGVVLAAGGSAATAARPVGKATTSAPRVHVGAALVPSSASLFLGSVLTTDRDGAATFSVKKRKTLTCNLTPDPFNTAPGSKVRVLGGGNLLVSIDIGAAVCSTSGPGSGTIPAGATLITVNDPVFSITVGKEQTVVKVDYGFAQVKTAKETLIVGPQQQGFFPVGGKAGLSEIAPTEQEKAIFSQFRAKLPPPNFRRPSPSGSRALATIYERGALIVGVDSIADDDKQTQAFVSSFADFLTSSWDLRFDVTSVRPDPGLLSEKVDVLLTPNPKALAGVPSAAFFTDAHGTTWYLATAPDKVFSAALASFISASLQTGEYALRYRAAFDADPSYARLSQYIFATPARTPQGR